MTGLFSQGDACFRATAAPADLRWALTGDTLHVTALAGGGVW